MTVTPGQLLRSKLPPGRHPPDGELASFDASSTELLQRAKLAWPQLHLDDERFLAFIADRLTQPGSVLEQLEQLHPDDLYLACACVEQEPGAIAAFEERVRPTVRGALHRIVAADLAEEVYQCMMTKLFTADVGKRPVIHQYQGRGELAGWVVIIATRDAYKVLRKERPRGDELDMLTERAIEVDDPELLALKRRYHGQFRRAFEVAFGRLGARDRNLLRHKYLDGLNIDEIGELYGVHRATVARWCSNTRSQLFEHTRRVFEEELAVEAGEFDSIMRLIQSQFDVSLERLLQKPTE